MSGTESGSASATSCSLCGGPIPSWAPAGHCPACLLNLGSSFGDVAAPSDELLDPVQLRRCGDYELLEEVARGGMGVVYRARQLSLGREVAVKMILAGELATAESVARFRNEATAAAKLDHPNIVSVYEVGQHDMQHFFSMRFVGGRENIATWAEALELSSTERASQIAAMMAKVARAVGFAHARGVLHRDLKPSNILMDENREPQVTDFGLAKLVDDDSGLTLSAAMLGSPSYMAPEQADARHREVTTATDVYGLGAVLYELLSGRPPFAGPTPLATARMVVEQMPAKLDDAPRDLATLCLKCLAKEPAQRYSSALSLAEDLERFSRGEPIRARPVTTPEAVWRWAWRKPAIAALLGAVLLAFVLGFAGVTWQWRAAVAARAGEQRALSKSTATVVDLYTHSGLIAAKDGDTTRAALWFAQAAATPGAEAASRESNLGRWAAWHGDSATAVRAFQFQSSADVPRSFAWRPSQDAIIVLDHDRNVEVLDLPAESRWLPDLPMRAAVWARHGQCVAFADGESVRLLEFPSGREVARRPRGGPVACLAVSPDDRWIAVGAPAPFLWETKTGHSVPLPVDAGAPIGLEFDREGKHLLITSAKQRGICAIDKPERFLFPPVESLSGKHLGVAAQGFLGRGELFIAHNQKDQLLVMKSGSGEVVETSSCRSDPQSAARAISPDGRFIARFSAPLIERGKGEKTFPKHDNRFEAVDFSGDGSLLATAGFDDVVRLWHLPDGSVRTVGWHQDGATAVAVSPDNRLLATGQYGGKLVRIWRIAHPPEGLRLPGYHSSRFTLSHDGRLFVPNGEDIGRSRQTQVYTVEDCTPVGPAIKPAGGITAAEFGPDDSWLATLSSTSPDFRDSQGAGTLELWDFRAGRRLGEPFTFTAEPRAIGIHPSGKKLAVYGARRALWEVDLATREVRLLHNNPPPTVADITRPARCRYSPNGAFLFAWGLGKPPLAWDGVAQKLCTPPQWKESTVWDMDIRGDLVGSCSKESEMQFLSIPDFRPAAAPIRDTNWLFVARFSPEGHLFLTGGRGRTARVWDWRTGKPHSPVLPHTGEVLGGNFLPGTECVVTSGKDQMLRFWDRNTGLPMRSPLRHSTTTTQLVVEPQSGTLFSAVYYGDDLRIYKIAELLPRATLPPEDALLLAEIDGAAEVNRASVEPLSPEAWLQKWKQFRAQHPEWHRW